MIDASYLDLKKGTFLIASPVIESGIFYRSVILICDHSFIGSFGLIINKPLEGKAKGEFLEIEYPLDMRVSGPHQIDQVMLLQDQSDNNAASLFITHGIYLNGDSGGAVQQKKRCSPRSILCFGYSEWSLTVLKQEFLDEIWFLCPATSRHIFEIPPKQLWQTLLQEMGGKYKTLSVMPENLDLN